MDNYLDSYKDAYRSSWAYSLDNKLILNWYTDRIIEMTTGQSLLELGIGHGYSSIQLSNFFKRHVVLEGSCEIIDEFKSRNNGSEIEIIHTFFEEFTTTEKFDVIVMGFILEHVDDPAFIVKKYKDYLNPGGKIYATVPNCEALNKRFGYEAGMLDDMFALSDADLAFGHKRLFTVETFRNLMEEAGYTVEKVEGLFLKPITSQQMIDLNLSEDILKAMLKVGVNYPELCVGLLLEAKV